MAAAEDRVFNFDRLEEVTGGDQEFEQELLEEFLQDTPEVFVRMSRAAGGGDLQSVANESHALKGSSLSLGAEELGRLAAKLEGAARQGDAHTAGPLVEDLESAFNAVRTAINQRIQRAA
jgi:HPt (histidine-containing phosphotransfer) domain-containing protein